MRPHHNQNHSSAPKVRAAEGGVPEDQWRRLHPISPLINAWKALVVLAAFILYQNIDFIVSIAQSSLVRRAGIMMTILLAFGAVLLFLVLVVIYSWLAWRATRFAVTPDGVYYRSGILMRTLKHARLDRIQAVDMSHPLLGRIFGLGRLNIEVAGGANSNVSFGFLKTAQLEALRAQILALAAGVMPAPSATDGAQPADTEGHVSASGIHSGESPAPNAPTAAPALAPVAPERVLYDVPIGRLVTSLFLNLGFLIGLFVALAILIGSVIAFVIFGPAALSGAASAVIGAFAAFSALWGRFASEFHFTAAVSPDGVRTRSGLLETRSQTVPPQRVHAVRVVQPWLWRHKGWYRVTITQAGYASGNNDTQSSDSADVLLPVGTRAEAELALWLVVRDLGVSDPAAFIDAALSGIRNAEGFVPIPPSAKLFDPFSWQRRAYALTDTCLVIRDGWLTHTTSIIPVERLQSIEIQQGPWQRARGLAGVKAHIVPGTTPSVVQHAAVSDAAQLVEHLRERSRIRRASEPPEKWMTRVTQVLDSREGAAQ